MQHRRNFSYRWWGWWGWLGGGATCWFIRRLRSRSPACTQILPAAVFSCGVATRSYCCSRATTFTKCKPRQRRVRQSPFYPNAFLSRVPRCCGWWGGGKHRWRGGGGGLLTSANDRCYGCCYRPSLSRNCRWRWCGCWCKSQAHAVLAGRTLNLHQLSLQVVAGVATVAPSLGRKMAALAVVVVKVQWRAVLETHHFEAHPKEMLVALVALHSPV
jgi:hypothetical protein